MDALKQHARNVYTLETPSAWIRAGGQDIWIVRGQHYLSISVFDPTKNDDPIENIFLPINKETADGL